MTCCVSMTGTCESRADDLMAIRERAGKETLDYGICQSLHQPPARHSVFNAVFIHGLFVGDRLNSMCVAPDPERAPGLLVAKLPAVQIAEMARLPSHSEHADAE